MNVKVSIITPCLNSEKTIRDTIESVLYQSYPDIEYIIVDGGSTDGTLDIIREYESLFCGRMKYVSEKDGGIYNAMNKGIRMSSGELIGIINSDDYYEPDTVKKILQYKTNRKYQVIYGYMKVLAKNRPEEVLKISHRNLDELMIPHSTCFVSRAVYQRYGLFLEWFKIAADYEFMLRLYKAGTVQFTQIKEILSNFRAGGASYNPKLSYEADIARIMHGSISVKQFLKRLLSWMT